MRKYLLNRLFVFALAVWSAILSVPAPNAFAMPSPSLSLMAPASVRDAQIAKIMTVLSAPQAQMHLRLSGINPNDLQGSLSKLGDAQLSQIADRADSVKAGGDGLGIIIAILVVVLLVVLIMKLADKQVIVRDK